jgi:hypothetical protein
MIALYLGLSGVWRNVFVAMTRMSDKISASSSGLNSPFSKSKATNARKLVLVPDRALADYLHHQFSDSKLEKMEIGITDEPKPTGRPRKHNSDREKAAIQRQKAKERRIQILKEHLRLNSQDMERSGCGDHKEGSHDTKPL